MRILKTVVLSLVVIFSSIAIAAPNKDNAVVYFSFDEIANGRVVEGTGKADLGTIKGEITLVDGKRGKAGQFKPNSYLDIGKLAGNLIPDDEITISVWFNVPVGTHEILNARASDETWIFHPELQSNGQYRWLVRTTGMNTIFEIKAGSIPWNTWTHFAGVYSASKDYAALYINGEEIARQPVKGAKMMQDWGLGARVGITIDDNRPFTGKMDDLIIWNKALSADDIKYVMENGIGK